MLWNIVSKLLLAALAALGLSQVNGMEGCRFCGRHVLTRPPGRAMGAPTTFMVPVLLEAMRYLLLTCPLEEFRHESDKVPAYQLPFVQRFFWVLSIFPRGIGWSFKVITSYDTRFWPSIFSPDVLFCITGRSPHSRSSSHPCRIHSLAFAHGFDLLPSL